MNYLLLTKNNLAKNEKDIYVVKDRKTCEHFMNIVKVVSGDTIKVVLVNEGSAVAEIIEISHQNLKLLVRDISSTSLRKINLALAGVRPLMAKRILEHATTMGVRSFHFFKADFSEKSYFDSGIYQKEKYQKYLEKGISQTGRYCTIPPVDLYESLDLIPFEKFTNVIFLDCSAQHYFIDDVECQDDLLLLIGPERGWSDREVLLLKEKGFGGFKISDSILRVEFAVSASLAQLEYIRSNRELLL